MRGARNSVAAAASVAALIVVMLPGAARADAPTATTTTIMSGATTATVTGTINPNGDAVSYWVRWDLDGTIFCGDGSDTTQPSDYTPSPLPQLSAADPMQTVSITMTGLTAGHTYCAELVVENDSTNQVIEGGPPLPFIEERLPPQISSEVGTPADPTDESVSAAINPNGLDTSYVFGYDVAGSQWCTTQGASGSPSQSLAGSAGNGGAAVQESATLANLTPGQTYCWVVQATNSAGAVTGFGGTFLAGLPLATTSAATSVTDTTATLNAVVDPEGNDTNYTFDYAPSSDPFCSAGTGSPNATGVFSVGVADTSNHSVSAQITGLAPGTGYCFEAAASNAVGVTLGGLMTFTTTGGSVAGGGGGTGGGTSTGGSSGAGTGVGSSTGTSGTGAKNSPAPPPKPSCAIANASSSVILKKPHRGKPKTPLDSIVLKLTCSQTSSATLIGGFSARVKRKTRTFPLASRHLTLTARAGRSVTIGLPAGALKILSARGTLTASLKLTATDAGGASTATRSFKLHGSP